jgi:hypothetical protein
MQIAVQDTSPELIKLPATFAVSILFDSASSHEKSIHGNGNGSGNEEGSNNLIANNGPELLGRRRKNQSKDEGGG